MQILLETTENQTLQKVMEYAQSLGVNVSTLPTLPQGKTKEEKEALLKKLQAFEITDFPLQEALDSLNNETVYPAI